jgi:hypothetical protein
MLHFRKALRPHLLCNAADVGPGRSSMTKMRKAQAVIVVVGVSFFVAWPWPSGWSAVLVLIAGYHGGNLF